MNIKKTIFLVDDETTNLTIGKEALSGIYNVFTLNSAEALFNMLKNVEPDLILLDINMPKMDGYEAIEKLKSMEKTKKIPVIFLTSLNDEQAEMKALQLGAVDFVMKPFSTPILIRRIETHISLNVLSTDLQKELDDRTKTVVELQNALISTLAEIVEHRDGTTGEHIYRVKTYIKILIQGLKEQNMYKNFVDNLDLELVLESSQLHDIGKITISDSILLKKERLTPEEFEVIKQHTIDGKNIIDQIKEKTTENSFLEYAALFAISHHEKWDGTGYPYGLSSENIPFLGRVLAIADVYDALTSVRTYKPAMTHMEAVNLMINDSGKHFDPTLIELFKKTHPKFEEISKNQPKRGITLDFTNF